MLDRRRRAGLAEAVVGEGRAGRISFGAATATARLALKAAASCGVGMSCLALTWISGALPVHRLRKAALDLSGRDRLGHRIEVGGPELRGRHELVASDDAEDGIDERLVRPRVAR